MDRNRYLRIVVPGAVGVVPFLPTDLSDLFWWTRAGFGVTESGGDVSQVDDFGSANLPQVQATGLDQPTLVNNVINGHPVIRYDGTDHFMTAGAPSDWTFLHNGDPYTIFEVWQTTDANPGTLSNILGAGNYDPASRGMNLGYEDRGGTANNALRLFVTNGTDLVISVLTSDDAFVSQTPGISEITYERGIPGDDGKIYVDGVLKGSADETNVPSAADSAGTLHIGELSNGSLKFKGDKAETIIYKRALSDSERLQVRNYLQTKFATP